jgi:UDPglucose 6-dehydrogenase
MLALIKTGQNHGVPLRSVETAVAVNDARKGEMVRKIVQAAGGSVAGKTIAVLGLTFKAGTDDMRSAVSLVILPRLIELGATLRAFDPAGMEAASALLPEVTMAGSLDEAAAGADLALILTEWPEFRQMDLNALAATLVTPLLVDLRNLFEPARAAGAGLTYVSIGRATAQPPG